MWDGNERRENNDLGWVKKGIFTLAIALMAHFGAGIWWAATTTARLEFVQDQMISIRKDLEKNAGNRYTVIDASRDTDVVKDRFIRNEKQISANTDKINDLSRTKYSN